LRALDLFGLILYSLTGFVATRFIVFAMGDLLPFFVLLGVAVQASYFGDARISAAKELNQTALFYAARQVRVFFSRFFVKGPVRQARPIHALCLGTFQHREVPHAQGCGSNPPGQERRNCVTKLIGRLVLCRGQGIHEDDVPFGLASGA